MYAVIETGGKQYRVSPGDTIEVEKIEGEPGSEIVLGRVLAVSTDDNQLLSGPGAAGARVRATIAGADRDAKVIVFKFKRKKQYRRTMGHRQSLTQVRVEGIEY
jgi:large subunit ribosomal protein L21